MRRLLRGSLAAFLMVVGLLALPAITRADGPAATATRPTASVKPHSWSGEWKTTWGTMTLRQSSDGVEGTYGPSAAPAKISGKVNAAGRFEFKYDEGVVRGEGWFELAADGATFAGKWRSNGTAENAWQNWTGERVGAAGPAAAPAAAAAPAVKPAQKPTFAGEWQTTYGQMTLTQTGDAIEGTYAFGGTVSKISGKVDEKGRFTFTYTEPIVTGEGWFELSTNGNSFSGEWREEGQKDWATWTGKRVSGAVAVNKDSFTGLWETTYGRMRLRQTEKSVTGIYAFAGRSSVTGTVEARKLTYKYEQPDGEKGSATVELAADGESFTGTWKGEKQALSSGGKWEGRRVKPQAGKVWLVVLEAPWEHALAENEYSFGLMLRTFFARVPKVEVRHKLLNSESDFKRWTSDLPYLAEPVVLYISSHGSQEGINVGGKTIGPKEMANCIRDADNIMLMHFGSCLVCGGPAPKQIQKELGAGATFPISGFTKVADWAGSAVVDFTYLDLIFSRGMTPAEAVRQTRKMLTFAADGSRNGEVIAPVGLVVFEP